jgi:hypothetical protein
MSETRELNMDEMAVVSGGATVFDSSGEKILVHRSPENESSNAIPDLRLDNGDQVMIIGSTINEMTPVRVLKNNISGYVWQGFIQDK